MFSIDSHLDSTLDEPNLQQIAFMRPPLLRQNAAQPQPLIERNEIKQLKDTIKELKHRIAVLEYKQQEITSKMKWNLI